MITSALASAQSATRLLCAAENEIKTIVQWGSVLGTVTSQDLTQSGALAPFKISTGKGYRISTTPATSTAATVHWPVKLGDPGERAHPVVNTSFQAGTLESPLESFPIRSRFVAMRPLSKRA